MEILHKKFRSHDLEGDWALLIGNFDGLHLGHMALVDHVLKERESLGLKAGLLTFEPHPKLVLQPDNPFHHIYEEPTKWRLLEETGLDASFVIPFTREFAKTSPQEFCDKLFDFLSIKSLVVGYDFNFGKAREGGAAFLEEEAQKRGIRFTQMPPIQMEGLTCSSTLIRRWLFEGNFVMAAKMLGRPWRMHGKVVQGKKLGRDLGFPTMNLLPEVYYPLRLGVYVIKAWVRGQEYRGVANLGYNPTVQGESALKIEAHLFDFDQDCYGECLELEPLRFLREEHRFESLEALKAQIKGDVERAKNWLKEEYE